jgi:hypothetical protein
VDEFPYALIRRLGRASDELAAQHVADHEARLHLAVPPAMAIAPPRHTLSVRFWLLVCLLAAVGIAGAAVDEASRSPL